MQRELLFSDNLKYFRQKNGLTQKELAEKIGYSEKAVNKWEKTNTIPSINTLMDLCDVLNISLYDLIYKRSSKGYCLGIDGGGSKTVFLLTDENLEVIKRVEKFASVNPNDAGLDECMKILKEGINETCMGYPQNRINCFAGISGASVGDNPEILSEFFSEFGFASAKCDSDLENIIELGLKGNSGIVVIMGTGISAYAVKGNERKRIGGWGHYFDKGGSGYNIGRDGIYAAYCAIDGSGEDTVIRDIIEKEIGMPLEMHLKTFYSRGKRYIASFCKNVFEAYRKGDRIAARIIKDNVYAVANLLIAGSNFLGEKALVSFAGGVMHESKIIFPMLYDILETKKFELKVIEKEPAYGAVQIARKEFLKNAEN